MRRLFGAVAGEDGAATALVKIGADATGVGIDVSDYQSPSINWSTLKNTYGITFGWAKASEGTSSTTAGGANFPTYEANAKAAGVIIGFGSGAAPPPGRVYNKECNCSHGVQGEMFPVFVQWGATPVYTLRMATTDAS